MTHGILYNKMMNRKSSLRRQNKPPHIDRTGKTATGGHNLGNSGTRQVGQKPHRRGKSRPQTNRYWLHGMHTVRAALANPARQKFQLLATANSIDRINVNPALFAPLEPRLVETDAIIQVAGTDAVHQGIALEVAPLQPGDLDKLQHTSLLLVLDQITDPHNVGAILRTAVAMDAGAVITTNRHGARETSVLAKSASGALDMIDHILVGNLSKAISTLSDQGYFCIGLDSEGSAPLEETFALAPHGVRQFALVLGSEGQGLRKKTRETCNALARLDMPGSIKSLNVSNAAAIALYAARKFIAG